ncbi:MAG: hypothetical protein Q9215_000356 [Flavoplaca cf. flavocitrina]
MELFDQEEWFALMAKDPDMPTPEEIEAIKEYIHGRTTADLAAQRCTSRIYLEEENPDPTLIWSLLESLAVEFPNTQENIVELLAAIKRRPNPIRDDFRRYGVETIEDALEEKNLKENHTREFFLPAAANQIIFASYPIWNLRNDPELEHYTMVLEWNRWEQTFEELIEHSQLSQETRGLLQQALAAMESVAQDPDRDDWQRKLVQYQAQYRASLNSARNP